MKIKLFSSATDENKAIFVGQHGRRKYVHIFIGLAGRRKYWTRYISSAIWPTKILGFCLRKTAAHLQSCLKKTAARLQCRYGSALSTYRSQALFSLSLSGGRTQTMTQHQNIETPDPILS
jgi:hypothetical protein